MNAENDERTPLGVLAFARRMLFPIRYSNKERVLGPREGSAPPPYGTRICIKNLPSRVFEDRIAPLFIRAGNIHKTRLYLSDDGLENCGTAFITFETKFEANRALRLNNSEVLPGYKIRVDLANENRRIFVRPVPTNKTKVDIYHELVRVGFKQTVNVATYPSLWKMENRGFFFVEFFSELEAEEGFKKLNDVFLFGQRVHPAWSIPMNEFSKYKTKSTKTIFVKNLDVLEKNFANQILQNALKETFETIETISHSSENCIVVDFKTRNDAHRGIFLLRDYFKHVNEQVELGWMEWKPNQEVEKENLGGINSANMNISTNFNEPLGDIPSTSNASYVQDEYCRALLSLTKNSD